MSFLSNVSYLAPKAKIEDFPFNLAILSNLSTLNLPLTVAVFVGENGAGKSTLLESLAVKINLQSLGEKSLQNDSTLEHARSLSKAFTLSWHKKTNHGFFLRAEDYFAYLKQIEMERDYYKKELKRIDEEFKDRSRFVQALAKGPINASLGGIQSTFKENADAQSHGESFLNIFQQRLKGIGIYIIDEPEAALSPVSQLALIKMITDSVQRGSQFLIATHSPILMAIPNAEIFNCDVSPPTEIEYNDIEHVNFYRSFLQNPENFVQRLR